MSIFSLYHSVRKRVRDLAHRDSLYVVWAYSQFLQARSLIPPDIEVHHSFLQAPLPDALLAQWTFEEITREVVRYAGEASRRKRTLQKWNAIAEIANTLRELEGLIYKS